MIARCKSERQFILGFLAMLYMMALSDNTKYISRTLGNKCNTGFLKYWLCR